MLIGVLALQGDVIEHRRALEACGVDALDVRTVEELSRVEGLIIPGGESTTLGKLMKWYGLDEAIRERGAAGMPIYGTCAGTILLARKVVGRDQAQPLGLMDIEVERNSYGRQLDSFVTKVNFEEVNVGAVFIRAPRIKAHGAEVKVLAEYEGDVVLARQGNLLVSTFHPELTEDRTLHQYFINMIHESK